MPLSGARWLLAIAPLCTLFLFPTSSATADLAAIEQAAEKQVKAQPTAENWQKLGLARFMQNRFEAAIPAFREAAVRDASLWPSRLFLGISLYRTNQFSTALESLQSARKLAPEGDQGSEDVDYWLGATHIALRQAWDGIRILEKLVSRNSLRTDALALLSRTYADQSGTLWNDVAERFFESPAGMEVHGHALESEGNAVDALDAYRKARQLAPERAGPGREIGRLLLQAGKTAEALDALTAERKLSPRDPDTAFLTALALMQSGRTSDAVPLLEMATAWARNDGEAPITLAQALLVLKRPEEAAAAARKAMALDPASEAARELLAAALQQSGQTP